MRERFIQPGNSNIQSQFHDSLMIPFFSLYQQSVIWFWQSGMRVVFVLAGAYLLARFMAIGIDRMMRRAVRPDFTADADAEQKRKKTIAGIVVRTSEVTLYLIAAMMILSEFGINIGPLVAGAGVLGVAIGFGSQQLVKDVISGLFIVMENRYHVGDAVIINGISGIVDDLNLRVTKLRDVDGVIHYVPNGSVATCANASTEGGRINLSLKISTKADLNRAREIANAVGASFSSDDATKTSVRRPISVVRIESFDPDWIVLRLSGDADPLKQWELMSELKQRLKLAFDEAGIQASA